MAKLSAERWQVLDPYLDQVLEIPRDERRAWLAALDLRHPEVAADLRSLLEEHEALAQEGFLEQRPSLRPDGPTVSAGATIGAYRLVSLIGQGGMGSVWLAERNDGRFVGRAALKLLNISIAGAGEERFRQEGNILARLTHPHIARLVDAGLAGSGQPYLVLEHVEGQAIDRHCDRRNHDIEARILLFLDVLQTVAHAHANLVVHRDLKPSNVLVTDDGQVKLLDFGIAKLLSGDAIAGDPTPMTRDAGVALTPEYAAPEQITGEPISTATDIYSLGVLLYELLTGCHPVGAALRSPAALVRATVEVEPPRMSLRVASSANGGMELAAAEQRGTTPEGLRRRLAGDLDTIVAKALKKAPEERYASVIDLADDLRRHLSHLPIRARPDTLGYRASRFVRRNRATVSLAAVVFASALIGWIGTSIQARTAREQRDFALRQLARAEAINDLNNFLLSDAAPSGRPFTVNDLLLQAEQITGRQRGTQDLSRIDVLISIGRQYATQDEDDNASRVLTAAYDLSRGLTDPSVRARASCALGAALARSGDLPAGERQFQEGLLELDSRPQFALDRVFCQMRGSEVARHAGEAQEGIARIRTAQRLLGELPARFELTELRLQIDLAEAYRVSGRHPDAASTFADAWLRLASFGRDHTQTAGTLLNNWGLSLAQFGRPLEAEQKLRRAIDISRAGVSEGAVSPMLLINYARVLRELGRVAEAADYAGRGHAKAREVGNQVVIYQSLLLLAWIELDRGDLSRAAALLSEVEPILRTTFPPGHIALAALASYQARLERQAGHPAAAFDLVNEATAMLESSLAVGGPGADFLPTLLVLRADVARELGRMDGAGEDAERALALLRASAPLNMNLSTLGRAYLAHGRVLDAQHRRDEARAALLAAEAHLRGGLGAGHPDTLAAAAMLR